MTIIVTIAVVVIGTNYITPVYSVSTVLRIAMSAGGPLEYSDYMSADRLMNTYVQIATSRPVIDELVETLGLIQPPNLKAEIIPNTELIKITVEDTDPKKAATIANTLADILIAQSSQIYIGGGRKLTEVLAEQLTKVQEDAQEAQDEYEKLLIQTPSAPEKIDVARQLLSIKQANYATLLSQYENARFREEIQSSMITVWETANIPKKPSRPNIVLNYALGIVAGLIGGLGLALAFENLDTTLYTTEDIELVTKLSAIGGIQKSSKRQIENALNDYSPLSEAFRNLATVINQKVGQGQSKTILMISAQPNQGKSMIVHHLALALSELGKRVIVVDCDTRVARMHDLFNLPNQSGLKDVLEQKTNLEGAIQETSHEGVSLLTSGSSIAHPSQLLGSSQMSRLLTKLKQKYDIILLDSPAFLAAADVTTLTPNSDYLLLVVRRAYAKREALQAVVRYLENLDGKPVYLVVNQIEIDKGYGNYKYRKKPRDLAVRLEKILPGSKWQDLSDSGTHAVEK